METQIAIATLRSLIANHNSTISGLTAQVQAFTVALGVLEGTLQTQYNDNEVVKELVKVTEELNSLKNPQDEINTI